jgi:hypothetical protein
MVTDKTKSVMGGKNTCFDRSKGKYVKVKKRRKRRKK